MKNKSVIQIFVAMIAGYVLGLLVGPALVPFAQPVGDIFVRLIQMLVVPLVFSSIAGGVAGMSNIRQMKSVGIKITLVYICTSIVASFIGLGMAMLIKPGIGFTVGATDALEPRETQSLIQNIVNMVPKNIFEAFTNMSMVQIIVFAIFVGVCLVMLGDRKKPVTDLLDIVTEVMTTMTGLVMKAAPIGVFALMCVTGAKYGFSVILPLGKFFGAEYLSMILHILITYCALLIFMAKVNPLKFFRRILPVLGMTLSTTSSNATLPVTLRVAEEKMGVPNEIGSFTLPLGATVNLDGTALNVPIIVLFTAQIYGITFTPGELFTLLFSTIVISVGAAGIPSGLTPFIIALLAQFNLPTEAFGIILASYRLLDMGLTSMNVMGDVVSTVSVANSEKALDRSVWDSKTAKV